MKSESVSKDFLTEDIQTLKGVGAKRGALYLKLGISTVGDLLRHYPRGYTDMSATEDSSLLQEGNEAAVSCTVDRKSPVMKTKGGRYIQHVDVSDPAGNKLELIYFNNRFGASSLEIGEKYVFFGKVQLNGDKKSIYNPVVVKEIEMEGLTPSYPLTEGLTSRMIASNVRNALEADDFSVSETLPDEIISLRGLLPIEEAIRKIHFPDTAEDASRARHRLVYEELFNLSLGIRLKKEENTIKSGNCFEYTDTEEFITSLPFTLTGAQKRCIEEIAGDLGSNKAMNRLLQGDVGSGKTAVAAAAVYLAAANGYQSAVMAPTEILARQHAETFSRFLAPFGINVALLTGSVKGKARKELEKQIENGKAQLIIGTHALISESVKYNNLGLVVADEQHRFGVAQRSALLRKGSSPHMLVMSATPIPRTLSLIVYGDLDISVIDERPAGRTPVKTLLVDDSYRERYLGFVRQQVEAGGQAYVVCPLVEESDALDGMSSATGYYDEIRNSALKGIPVGLLHGKMSPEEKAAVMENFSSGNIKVLVSTTVVEVGVDCPNATLIIIENAERFGLSTLHQLRGRVGRGNRESWCVLVSPKGNTAARERLKVLCSTDDGFEIARYDLETRGPGDFIGNRQHGLPSLVVADFAADEETLYTAAGDAERILGLSPDLGDYPALRETVNRMFREGEVTFN